MKTWIYHFRNRLPIIYYDAVYPNYICHNTSSNGCHATGALFRKSETIKKKQLP